jgi:hypothetical protein
MKSPGTPVDTSHKRAHKIELIAAACAVLLIVVVCFIIALVGEKAKTESTGVPSKPVFKNQLTPSTELKVGTHRYVSPCQVLPLASAAKIFGKATPATKASEESLAVSIPTTAETYVARTECSYSLSSGVVKLNADQYVDASELKDVSSVFNGTSEEIKAEVDGLKQKAGGDSDAQALVKTLDTSLLKFDKYQDEFDDDVLAKANFDGMILPDFLGDMLMIQGNVVYQIDAGKPFDKLTSADIGNLGQAFEAIQKNASNSQLDQSPIATILGNTDHIGATKIIEPCVILDGAMFKAISGVDENGLVSRVTLPVDANRDLIDQQVHKRVIFSNSCQRTHDADPTDSGVQLQLNHAKTVEYAIQYVKDFNDDTAAAPPEALQTNADEAFVFHSSLQSAGETGDTYLFRVGPYVAVLDISTKTSTGGDSTFADAGRDQYTQAINLLVDRLKQAEQ